MPDQTPVSMESIEECLLTLMTQTFDDQLALLESSADRGPEYAVGVERSLRRLARLEPMAALFALAGRHLPQIQLAQLRAKLNAATQSGVAGVRAVPGLGARLRATGPSGRDPDSIFENYEGPHASSNTEDGGPVVTPPQPAEPAPSIASRERTCTEDFDRAVRELSDAVDPLNAQIDAARGGIWADRTPLYQRILAHYDEFCTRLAQLEPEAIALCDLGRGKVLESINAQKADIQGAAKIVKEMITARGASNAALMASQLKAQSDWFAQQQKLHESQQAITALINSHR